MTDTLITAAEVAAPLGPYALIELRRLFECRWGVDHACDALDLTGAHKDEASKIWREWQDEREINAAASRGISIRRNDVADFWPGQPFKWVAVYESGEGEAGYGPTPAKAESDLTETYPREGA